MKFTKNEKHVLKLLLDNGRASDVEMASDLKISTQAVGKIRKKLEEQGVIEGYSCVLNMEKIGLHNFVLMKFRFKDKMFEEGPMYKYLDTLKKTPEMIFSFLTPGSDASMICAGGFRNQTEMDRYFHMTQATFHGHAEILKTYPFSNLNFLKNSSSELCKMVLEDKPIVPTLTSRR